MKLVKFFEGEISQKISFKVEQTNNVVNYFKLFDFDDKSRITYNNFTPYYLTSYLKVKDNIRSLIQCRFFNFDISSGIKYSYFTFYYQKSYLKIKDSLLNLIQSKILNFDRSSKIEYDYYTPCYLEAVYNSPSNILNFFSFNRSFLLKSNESIKKNIKVKSVIVKIITKGEEKITASYPLVKVIENFVIPTKENISFNLFKILENLKYNIVYSAEDNLDKSKIVLDISTNKENYIEIDLSGTTRNEKVKSLESILPVYYSNANNTVNINLPNIGEYKSILSTNSYIIDISFKVKPYKNFKMEKR